MKTDSDFETENEYYNQCNNPTYKRQEVIERYRKWFYYASEKYSIITLVQGT